MSPRSRPRAASSRTRSSRCATSESRRWRQAAAWLAGLWAGALVCIGALAAPAAFATLSRSDAGRFVGTLFQRDAHAGLTVAVVLLLLFRSARRTGERALDTDTLLVMGAVFCIVAGYFALIPLMEAARSGQGPLSFMTLHLVSVLFFAVKTVCVAWLAWRLHAASGSNP